MVLKKYVVVPYIEKETDGFLSGNVYIGGFPGDGEGGFTMGGGGPNDGPDGFSGGDDSAAGGTDPDGAATDDDVVDVDFTVEEEDQKRTD